MAPPHMTRPASEYSESGPRDCSAGRLEHPQHSEIGAGKQPKSREQVFAELQNANARISVLKMQISRAKSDLFLHNKPTHPTLFSKWQTELAYMQRKSQALQFELGQIAKVRR